MKKKTIKDDPFGSDDGEADEEQPQSKSAKRKAPASKKKPSKDSDYDGSDSGDAKKTKTNTKLKKGRAPAKKATKEENGMDVSDSEDDRPKKRRVGAQ